MLLPGVLQNVLLENTEQIYMPAAGFCVYISKLTDKDKDSTLSCGRGLLRAPCCLEGSAAIALQDCSLLLTARAPAVSKQQVSNW